MIDEFHQQTGQVGILGNHERDFSEYSAQTINQSWADEDQDGMPDTWELKMGVEQANSYDLSDTYSNVEVFLNGLALCPTVAFDSSSLLLPAGTKSATIPYVSSWESWSGGQAIEVCVNGICSSHVDTGNEHAFVANGLRDGNNLVTITPVGSDGVKEAISASIEVNVGS